MSIELDRLEAKIEACRLCPRLVAWREETAAVKRAAFRDQAYWGRPVPGFGDPDPWLLVVGLAPAAHGANRTGRMFTGDRSGDWLYAGLHRAGFASQPGATARGDGMELTGVFITAAVRCAPPDNKPTTGERDACLPWLQRELDLLHGVRVIVALGGFSFQGLLREFRRRGQPVPRPQPKFSHGVEVPLNGVTLLGSYHPSQQNTFTGRLTEEMFDAVWIRALELGAA